MVFSTFDKMVIISKVYGQPSYITKLTLKLHTKTLRLHEFEVVLFDVKEFESCQIQFVMKLEMYALSHIMTKSVYAIRE